MKQFGGVLYDNLVKPIIVIAALGWIYFCMQQVPRDLATLHRQEQERQEQRIRQIVREELERSYGPYKNTTAGPDRY